MADYGAPPEIPSFSAVAPQQAQAAPPPIPQMKSLSKDEIAQGSAIPPIYIDVIANEVAARREIALAAASAASQQLHAKADSASAMAGVLVDMAAHNRDMAAWKKFRYGVDDVVRGRYGTFAQRQVDTSQGEWADAADKAIAGAQAASDARVQAKLHDDAAKVLFSPKMLQAQQAIAVSDVLGKMTQFDIQERDRQNSLRLAATQQGYAAENRDAAHRNTLSETTFRTDEGIREWAAKGGYEKVTVDQENAITERMKAELEIAKNSQGKRPQDLTPAEMKTINDMDLSSVTPNSHARVFKLTMVPGQTEPVPIPMGYFDSAEAAAAAYPKEAAAKQLLVVPVDPGLLYSFKQISQARTAATLANQGVASPAQNVPLYPGQPAPAPTPDWTGLAADIQEARKMGHSNEKIGVALSQPKYGLTPAQIKSLLAR